MGAVALLPTVTLRIDTPYLPFVVASDAAPAFGFGVSVCPCPLNVIQDLFSFSETRGDYIRCFRMDGDEPEVPRTGVACRLPVSKHDFQDVLAIKARSVQHS